MTGCLQFSLPVTGDMVSEVLQADSAIACVYVYMEVKRELVRRCDKDL